MSGVMTGLGDSTYGKRKLQIKKEDLYMLTALWMEQSPWAMTTTDSDKERIVGAVFVQPNDRVLSVDCSRENDGGIVHGAIRALIKYPDQVEGCYVYLSRQPCAHCVKMLVQAAVKKVFYLPLKPEKDEQEENRSVDALFKVSPVSREVYVPNITKGDLDELASANKKNLYGKRKLEKDESVALKVEWEEWKDNDIVAKIGWDEYSDTEIKNQVDEDMKLFFKWYVQGILETGDKEEMAWEKVEDNSSAGDKEEVETPDEDEDEFDREVANHLSRLAQMLSNRTDDPNTGVGCVITIDKEIVAIGWNGYPSKALYGNHPRGSKEDKAKKKYPHIIYALENALLFRNRRELDGCVVYHTIVPSDEGISMLYQVGAKVLVLPSFLQEDELKKEKPLFYNCLPEKKLDVYRHIKG
ncbi:cytidine and dCMP deaminase domain-containing protein 1-like [Actinia tenebrosa]|uniref:dCMP deaminase n=1 Tax=Actinia tenebrosa TaxID=6105 RepID=A0A6P8IAD1_ACTTE|nr:cytidine and dCMP deaminase domain-containing protein 1-like [Actinia tenebrosa]